MVSIKKENTIIIKPCHPHNFWVNFGGKTVDIISIDNSHNIARKENDPNHRLGDRRYKQYVVKIDTTDCQVYILHLTEHFNCSPQNRIMDNHSSNVPMYVMLRKVQDHNIVHPTIIIIEYILLLLLVRPPCTDGIRIVGGAVPHSTQSPKRH